MDVDMKPDSGHSLSLTQVTGAGLFMSAIIL